MIKNKNLNFAKTQILLENCCRNYLDFPLKGIKFRDFSPLWLNPKDYNLVIDIYYDYLKNLNFDGIMTAEARGYILAAPLAYKLKKPLILIRKPNKLPGRIYKVNYSYEYANGTLEVQVRSLRKGGKYIFIDDVCATGSTFEACLRLALMADADIILHLYLAVLKDLNNKDIIGKRDCFYLTAL